MSDTTDNNSNKIFKIAIGVLVALLLSAVYFGVTNYTQLKDNESAFETEKSIKVAELKSIQKQYDNLLLDDAENKEEIAAAKERITFLLDSVKNIKPDMTVVNKLRKSQNYFKGQLKKLTAENELLKQQNSLLTTQKDSLSTELENSVVVYDSLSKTNKNLEMVVAKAQKLKISNVAPKAVRIKDSNKVVSVSKAKKATGFEVCFDVAANDIAEQGDKELFIQIVAPSKKVIGGQFYFEEGDRKLKFSKVSKFRFSNKAMNICDFVEPLDSETITPGNYSINVFNGVDLIHSSSVSLK